MSQKQLLFFFCGGFLEAYFFVIYIKKKRHSKGNLLRGETRGLRNDQYSICFFNQLVFRKKKSETTGAVADVGLPFWVRVSAVNGIGESEPSEALKLRCALPPGMQPAPNQLEGDLRSIIVGFSPENLHGADLLYHRLTYAFVDEVEGILNEIQLDVPGSEVRVNISHLLPFSTYIFKVQAMTESGLSLDPGWQVNMTTGSAILIDPPTYVS